VIGFVVPLEKEARTLIRVLKHPKDQTHRGREIITGLLDQERCAVFISGPGKIRSASGTQLLLDHFDCTTIYHFGSAGDLAPEHRIGDIVIANDIVEHDYKKTHDEYSCNGIVVCAKVCDFLIQFLSS
jgi:adenosylhomocysteine nucleosidase